MNAMGTQLRIHADEIASVTASLIDADRMMPQLRGVVTQLADRLDGHGLLDAESLRDIGDTDEQLAKILRSLQAACIEVGRREYQESDFPAEVIRLRACIRCGLPPSPVKEEHIRIFQELMEECPARNGRKEAVPLFRGIMAGLRDTVFVHDPQGYVLYMNDFGMRLLRFEREDLAKGLHVLDFIPPEYMDLVDERMEMPPDIHQLPFSIEVYAKDGERIPVSLDNRALPHPEVDTPILCVARDLRLERRLQGQIGVLNGRLDALMRHAPMGVIWCNAEGRVTDANHYAAAMCGAHSPRPLVEKHLDEIIPHEAFPVAQALKEAKDLKEVVHFRLAAKSPFGGRLDCEAVIAYLGEPRDQPAWQVLLIDNNR